VAGWTGSAIQDRNGTRCIFQGAWPDVWTVWITSNLAWYAPCAVLPKSNDRAETTIAVAFIMHGLRPEGVLSSAE
jgi:hypothetical protein